MDRCCNLCLGFGQKKNFVETHRLVNFARASAQGTATVLPSRSPALRRSISRRQASEMPGSSLPSKLSNKAATRADRSPVGSVKASSSKLSTRAFIFSSLAPLLRRVMRVVGQIPISSPGAGDGQIHQAAVNYAGSCQRRYIWNESIMSVPIVPQDVNYQKYSCLRKYLLGDSAV